MAAIKQTIIRMEDKIKQENNVQRLRKKLINELLDVLKDNLEKE